MGKLCCAIIGCLISYNGPGLTDKGLDWGVKVLFHYCAAGGDTLETGIRSCVLPLTIWDVYGLDRACEAGRCYFVSEDCACRLCDCARVDKYHLLRCEWASCEQL